MNHRIHWALRLGLMKEAYAPSMLCSELDIPREDSNVGGDIKKHIVESDNCLKQKPKGRTP